MHQVNGSKHSSSTDEPLDEAGAYASLSRMVLAQRPLSAVLEELALLAKRVLPETPEVSVTLLRGDHAETAAFTGAVAIELDERQYDAGFGPCIDAAVSGGRIKLVTADPDSPYPDWCRVAHQQGVTHSMSVGLPAAAPTVGALNIYNLTGRPFTAEAQRIAAGFATFAGMMLANAGLHQDLIDLAAQLEAVVRSRAVIDQAKGIIMAQDRCSDDDAFQVLVRASQTRNVKLALLAQQLVDSVGQPLHGTERGSRPSQGSGRPSPVP